MNSHNVYIDFEAITFPFASVIGLPNGTPFAYTIGLLSDKNRFESKTFIMDFTKHNSLTSIWMMLRKFIIADIHSINPKVDIKTVTFIGHNPVLEHDCLNKLFPENKVVPLIDYPNISLSKLTAKTFNQSYWFKTKKAILKTKKEFLIKRLPERNGAIASYAGYWLYVSSLKDLRANDRRKKFFIDLEKKTLLRELREYSRDDVLKMIFITQNIDELNRWIKEFNAKTELLKQIRHLKLDDKLTIKEIKEKIWTI